MKILWIPQVSSKSSTGQILFDKDSNMAFLKNLLGSEFGKQNAITLVLEFGNFTFNEAIPLNALVEARLVKDIKINHNHKFTNAITERLHFDVEFYQNLNLREYDIIFVNEPTKATNIRILLGGAKTPKIVSYNHWMAMDNMKQLELRQIEGMLNSDLCLLNSTYAIGRIANFCEVKNVRIPDMAKLQPSFPHTEMFHMKQGVVRGIVYNHRLSSDEYYMQAYRRLLWILTQIETRIGTENMPLVYFTNPSGKDFNILADKPYFRMVELDTQEAYYEFLKSDKVQLHMNTFFSSKGMWSMSTVEAGVCGNACLLPNSFGYSEIFQEDYQGYCRFTETMVLKLYKLLSENIDIYDFSNYYLLNHSSAQMGKNLNKILERVVKQYV